MNGKQLVLAAMQNKTTERTPWVPFVGCHAASLVGQTASEYLKSADNIVAAVNEAIVRYQPDGIPVTFDLQVEAEALGCDLVWADDNPPAVTSHPLETKDLSELQIPGPDAARYPIVIEATKRLVAQHPDIAFYGLITGPFTLALHLLGSNIFMMMFDDPAKVKEIMKFCQDVAIASAKYYIEAGCDIVAVVDPMTSQIGPEHFEEFVTPFVTPVFEAIREQGKLSSFFVCGHAEANIEAMCKCKADNISIDENISLSLVKEICQSHGVSFGGNMQLTVCLLFGTKDDCLRNGMDCMTTGGDTGFILAPGCDIPYAAPVENIQAITELVRDPYQQEIARTLMEQVSEADVNLDMSEYGRLDKVVIDIITLDSEACAPCQYMVEAVKNIMPQFENMVVWREHKIKTKESVEFMTALMVRNIPTICIDGEIAFVSRIPASDELIQAILERLNSKARGISKQHWEKLIVVGLDDAKSQETIDNVNQAIKELGVGLTVELCSDSEVMAQYAPEELPAVVAQKNIIKSLGKTPKSEIIKEWVKDLCL